MKRSSVPEARVKNVIEGGYQTIRSMTGRNPTPEQKERVREKVILEAKKLNRG